MPALRTPALILSVRLHGEHGAVVRFLTPEHGLITGFVRGARSRTMRPVLIPSNMVEADFRARTTDQLAAVTLELTSSRGPWLTEPLCNSALGWITALTAATLQESVQYPDVYGMLSALVDAICHAPSARGWAGALAHYELLLLKRLGFGLQLDHCVVSGATDGLRFVSPRSAQAVNSDAALGYEDKLLPLPAYLTQGGRPEWPDIFDALHLTGFFLERHLPDMQNGDFLSSRTLLLDRLKRAVA